MDKIKDRIAKSSKVSQECRTLYPPIPKSVKIEVTARCDLKCFFCCATYKPRKKGDIKPALLFKILDDLAANGVEEVGLFWLGESLLVDALPEYVAYAKKVGIKYVFITTNGRLATPERIKPLIDSGIDSIKFSINACNREEYAKVCGVDAYDQVIANVRSTWKLRGNATTPALYASTVFDPSRLDIYDQVRELVTPYVDQHYPLRIYGGFSYLDYKSYRDKIEKRVMNIDQRSLASMLPCWPLFNLPHISFEGDLSACYCDHNPDLFMGNLQNSSFKDVWYSPKIVELRRKHLEKDVTGTPCAKCIAYEKEND